MAAMMAVTWYAWCLVVALGSIAGADMVAPSNTTAQSSSNNPIIISFPNGDDLIPTYKVAPLTSAADASLSPQGMNGNLVVTTTDNYLNASQTDIAYISCDSANYTGFIDAADVLQHAATIPVEAVILYSTTAPFCNITGDTTSSHYDFIYSMTDANESASLRDRVEANPDSNMFFITLAHMERSNYSSNDDPGNGSQDQNPLGPSPTTTVAMIILYSITGIITALFLIIIITGAIRAHRHPERYGPRAGHGRPRQSRARGIARAMLETLPIVKFGDPENRDTTPKPTDVELGEARSVDAASREVSEEQQSAPAEQTDGEQKKAPATHDVSGLAPHEPAAAPSGAASTTDASQNVEDLTCSICTNDFEVGEDIRVLPCNHRFHPACVDRWLLDISGTCPLCRMDLRPSTSRTSRGSAPENEDELAPPLADTESSTNTAAASRRRSTFRELMAIRHATREERLAALRRMREESSGNTTEASEEGVDGRRRRIRTSVLNGFGIRTRRRSRQLSMSSEDVAGEQASSDESPIDPRRHGTSSG